VRNFGARLNASKRLVWKLKFHFIIVYTVYLFEKSYKKLIFVILFNAIIFHKEHFQAKNKIMPNIENKNLIISEKVKFICGSLQF